MSNGEDDPVLDDLFHACALIAFIQEAMASGGPPDATATRRRACLLYEAELRKINAAKT